MSEPATMFAHRFGFTVNTRDKTIIAMGISIQTAPPEQEPLSDVRAIDHGPRHVW